MGRQPTLLRALLRERHWQKYGTLCRQYDRAARDIDPALVGTWPSRSQLARWLGGDLKGLPHPDHCRVLEAMFPGLTARELFAPAATSRPDQDMPDISAGDVVASRRYIEVGPRDEGPPGPIFPGQLDGSLGSFGEEIAMATEESARFVRLIRGSVGQETLDQLEADVRQLACDYLRRPPYLVFRSVNRLRGEVFRLLQDQQRPAVLPRLYRVGGRLCALLAHASADLGQVHSAQTHARSAWICADLAEDDSLKSYVRWVESNVAYWSGDYRTAAEIAHSGQAHARSGTSLLRLASQEARAHAARREAREVERALTTAKKAAEASDGHDEGGAVFHFEPGKAAYYASEARLALGGPANVRQAEADARYALALFRSVPEAQQCAEFIAAAQLDLTAAHLADGDLDGAQVSLRGILDLPVENRTIPVVRRMVTTAAAIAGPRFARAALGADLAEQIGEFCAATAVRGLPARPG